MLVNLKSSYKEGVIFHKLLTLLDATRIHSNQPSKSNILSNFKIKYMPTSDNTYAHWLSFIYHYILLKFTQYIGLKYYTMM